MEDHCSELSSCGTASLAIANTESCDLNRPAVDLRLAIF